MKEPRELFFGTESKSLSQMKYLITKELFNSNNCYKNDNDFKCFINKLEDKKRKKLKNFAHFYYFICQPYKNSEDIREELRLVAITSLIEGMMENIKFKDFFQWFESSHKGVNKIEDYNKIKEEYLNIFGATRKIKAYFKDYILEDDKKVLLERVKPFKNDRRFVDFSSIEELASFLYKMRSDFVHRAKMRYLCPKDCSLACIVVDKKAHKVKIEMKEFMKVFERSFIVFWRKQI